MFMLGMEHKIAQICRKSTSQFHQPTCWVGRGTCLENHQFFFLHFFNIESLLKASVTATIQWCCWNLLIFFKNRISQVLLIYIQFLANSNTSPNTNTNIANTDSHLTDLCTHVSLPHSELLLVRQKDARIWNEQMIVLMGAKCLRNIPKINSNVKNLSHWFWPRRKDSSKTELRMISTAYIFISSSASYFPLPKPHINTI